MSQNCGCFLLFCRGCSHSASLHSTGTLRYLTLWKPTVFQRYALLHCLPPQETSRFPDPSRCSIPGSPMTCKEKEQMSKTSVLFLYVGEPGIEPGPRGPKPRTLPLCYTPLEIGHAVTVLNFIHHSTSICVYILYMPQHTNIFHL